MYSLWEHMRVSWLISRILMHFPWEETRILWWISQNCLSFWKFVQQEACRNKVPAICDKYCFLLNSTALNDSFWIIYVHNVKRWWSKHYSNGKAPGEEIYAHYLDQELLNKCFERYTIAMLSLSVRSITKRLWGDSIVYVLDISSDHVKRYLTISATLPKGYGFLNNASTIAIY